MVAMEFTSEYVHIIQGRYYRNELTISKAVTFPTPFGIIEDGYIKDLDELSKLIEFIMNDNDIGEKRVVLSLDSSTLKMERVQIPYKNKNKKNICMLLEKALGIYGRKKKYILEHVILNRFFQEEVPYMDCIVWAAPEKLLEAYWDLYPALGLKLKRIDVSDDSITKLLARQCCEMEKSEQELMGTLWVGFYYDRLKLVTRSADVHFVAETIWLTDLINKNSDWAGELGDKKRIALFIDAIRKILLRRETGKFDEQIERIEVFGEHQLLKEICGIMSGFLKKPAVFVEGAPQIKGLSDEELAKYFGVVGALLERSK